MTDEQPGLLRELKRRKVYRVAIAYVLVCWVALQFLDLVLENFNAPDWVMQTIMALFAIGFPIALVLAWAFDVTKDGIKATPARSRAFASLVAIVSVGALSFAIWSFTGDESVPGSPRDTAGAEQIRAIDSIAVLPFESFSENQSDEYFADGLADTLLHKLAQLPNLKVIARNSSFQFKGTNKDAREIGELLDVAALLEGSVQRQGDQIRVIAQLIDTVDGTHLWSKTFDDTMQNIFELQDRIATDIMMQLQVSISEQDLKRVLRSGTDNPEAFDLLLRANETERRGGREVFDPDTDSQLELIDRALELDPDYAQAWVARASVFARVLFFDNDPARALEYIEAARVAGRRAIEADPEYAGGYRALGMSWFRANNTIEAERLFIKSLELDPYHPSAMSMLGLIKINDDPQMALDLLTRTRELDPSASFVYRQIFFALSALGRPDEGLTVLLEGIERFPDHPILLSDITGVYFGILGRPDEAARWASQNVEADRQNFVGLSDMAAVWVAVSDVTRAGDWLALYAERFPGSPDVGMRRYDIAVRSNDPAAARAVIEAVPESPNFRFDRSIRIGGACLLLGDADCMREHADKMQAWLDEYEARGQAYRWRMRYELAIAVLRNAAIDNAADRDSDGIEALYDLTADWPISGGRPGRDVGYLRVMLRSLLGDDDGAVRELEMTLTPDSDRYLHRDMFRMPPEMNPLIARLQGTSGYAEWLATLDGRREAARGNLVRMEQSGEILSAGDAGL